MADHPRRRSETSEGFNMDSVSLEEKEGLLSPTAMDRYNRVKTLRHYSYVAIICFLVGSNLISAAFLLLQLRGSARQPVAFGNLPHVESTPSWLPPESWRTEIFERHTIYGLKPSGAAKAAWRAMIPSMLFPKTAWATANDVQPEGKGFVIVKNNTLLPDLPGLKYPEEEQHACVAVFHQLHCLYMTYAAYWDARDGNFDDIPPEHLIHCWDYLRQSLMCAGDTTLEWVSPYDKTPNATDGWGFQHTCRNFDAIYEWTDRHRSKENVGIE